MPLAVTRRLEFGCASKPWAGRLQGRASGYFTAKAANSPPRPKSALPASGSREQVQSRSKTTFLQPGVCGLSCRMTQKSFRRPSLNPRQVPQGCVFARRFRGSVTHAFLPKIERIQRVGQELPGDTVSLVSPESCDRSMGRSRSFARLPYPRRITT